MVRRVLQPRHPLIKGIVLGAWEDWLRNPESALYRYSRTRANIMWEHMVRRAEETFSRDPGIRMVHGHQTIGFLVDHRVFLRFKKGDEAGLSRNYPTMLALKFHDHQSPLPGIPTVDRVEIVYALDQLETEITSVFVVARNSDQVAWLYDILEEQPAELYDLRSQRKIREKRSPIVRLRRSQEHRDDKSGDK